jgi:inner membrane protein
VDPVTHTLVGVTLANAVFRRRFGPEAVPILAIASNLPDLDTAVHLGGDPAALLLRRSFGHSILLLPVWSLLLAAVLGRLFRRHRLRDLAALCLLGAGAHLVFDLINSFGVLLLWPLSGWRPEWAIVFIIDLVLTGLLAAPLLLAIAPRLRPFLAPLSRAALAGVAGYLSLCAGARAASAGILDRQALSAAARPEFSYLFPEPLGPHRWRGVVRDGDTYTLYLIRPLEGTLEERATIATRAGDPIVQRARSSPLGRRLDAFFKAPVWQVAGDFAADGADGGAPAARGIARGPGPRGDARRAGASGAAEVRVFDLRFRTLVLEREAVFTFSLLVHPDGRVEDATSFGLPPRATDGTGG